MVVVVHGMWWSCVDTATRVPRMAWPCREEIPNYRGFDYLSDTLADQGVVVVSIGVNGIDAAHPGGAYRDRARLVNEHLRLWRDLVRTGGGALAGRFVDPGTGGRVAVDFRGLVDLGRVGTLGHGQGGTAVLLHSDQSWPRGVRVRAVVAAAPVYNYALPVAPVDVPFAVLDGGCDASRGRQYVEDVRGRTTAGAYGFTVAGANHNNLNTEWAAVDDASPGGSPGSCTDGRSGAIGERRLTGVEQRRVATGYVAAFFLRHLLDRTEYVPMLTGRTGPLSDIARVDVEVAPAR